MLTMKKPNFFIIGAPKCGTTSVYFWLKDHPEIYMPPIKEPHHFYSPFGQRMSGEEYEKLFYDSTEKHKAVGEASVFYLFSGIAIDRILEYHPEAKFIVLLRNPIEMAISFHQQELASTHELETDFKKAWQLNETRSKGNPVKIDGKDFDDQADPNFLNYRKMCQVGSQLKYLYKKVEKERVLPILLDHIKEDSSKEYRKILRFLEVSGDDKKSFENANQTFPIRSLFLYRFLLSCEAFKKIVGLQEKSFGSLRWLSSWNNRVPKILDDPFKMRLLEVFDPEIRLLEKQLSLDLSAWRDVEQFN